MSNSSLPSITAGASAEAQQAAFALDPRISFSTVTKRWTFEDDNGSELEYDNVTGKWIPVASLLFPLFQQHFLRSLDAEFIYLFTFLVSYRWTMI